MKLMSWGARFVSLLALMATCTVAADLPPLPQGLTAPVKPVKMQAFNLPTAVGGTARSDDYKDKVIIARFWATWWDICVGDMPSVQGAQKEYHKSGIPVLAISLDGDGAKSVKPFLNEHNYTLTVPLDPEMRFARSLGVRVTPWTVIIDRNGNLVGGGYGRINMLSPEFRNYIKALSARAPGWPDFYKLQSNHNGGTMQMTRWRQLMVGVVLAAWAVAASAVEVGDKAPAFAAPSSTGKEIKLSDFAGKKHTVLFFYIGAFTNTWTQEALAFQLDLPQFEAANAQVLGISVDFNDANKAWGEKLGLKYPLLSDFRRQISRAYGVLQDDAAMAQDPARIPQYLRAKRSWFIVDKNGVVAYARVTDPRSLVPNDEMLEVLSKLK